jgi:23S rRNA pseudouridine2605 synthase
MRDPKQWIDLGRARFEVDGGSLGKQDKVYIAINKPRGLITTRHDPEGRQTIYSCLPAEIPHVSPVGRLDKASEGLLLLTNDNRWSSQILDPGSRLEKTYHVQVDRVADDALLESVRAGVEDRGEYLSVRRIEILRTGDRNSWLLIVLDEGRNRHIRRLLAAFGVGTLRLIRVAIGPVALGDLSKGHHRMLSASEVRTLTRIKSANRNP